ncbi:MFS transporter [Actinacidiphila acidipaludis]|uniref:MFS transporter n=1 Tax=Actinacidiphila acidipaludis TaxID=2873382 RepID=A0ABS7QD39_9ACTN|nr:MFS transporter [Streptomyces acidipaludis]MBY8881095.1 MFS transporter [Streptomyces acidipaludis]
MSLTECTGTAPVIETVRPQPLTGRLKIVLAVLLVAQFMLAVDFSILNVALPDIGQGLGISLGNLQWIATAFALCAGGFTLLFGRIADLFGRRRLFLVGLAVLGLASLAGGLATSPTMLITARVFQGLATAAVTPAGLSLMTTSFPEGPARDRALGLNGALMSAGFTTGAVLGGVLTDLLSWRWAFFINVPVALVVLLIAPSVIKESRPTTRPRLDLPGAALVTLGLLALVFGFTQAGRDGWGSVTTLGSLALGAALLALFYAVERRQQAPLMPVTVLRRPTVAWGNAAGLVAFLTETSLVFLLTLYLQKVLGFSPLEGGLSFGVLGLGTVTGGSFAPRIIGRIGTRAALIAGGVIQAVATIALLGLSSSTGGSLALLLIATFVGGVGNMLVIVGFMITATSGLPDHEQGLATGVATMTQQIGITMGTPIMSAIATGAMASSAATAVLHGVSVAIAVNASLVLLAVAVAAVCLRSPRAAAAPAR